MHAEESRLRPLLEGTLQYQIPLFQRSYAWTKAEWQTLWKSITRQYELATAGEAGPTHFLGSFVFAPIAGMASSPSPQRVVDGQQRITTIQLLLAAMRDLLAETDVVAIDRFNDLYLKNKYQSGDEVYKLVPSQHDRDAFFAILNRTEPSSTGGVTAAYRYFRNELLKAKIAGWDFARLEEVLVDRIYVVEISTAAEDSVHRIFQTLNSSGVALDQVDLLRNHFFMLLPTTMEDAYESIWRPLETEIGVKELDYFLWADLICRGKDFENLPRHSVYSSWQRLLEESEGNEVAVTAELSALLDRGRVYRTILTPSLHSDPDVQSALLRSLEWGSTIQRPVILKILLDLSNDSLSKDDALKSLHILESYLVRRLLAKVPTNQLKRIFNSLLATLNGAPIAPDALRKTLSARANVWPTDADIKARMRSEQFYKAQQPPQRQFVLRRLEESFGNAEVVNWGACEFTIEHVMPQNLNETWFRDLETAGSEPTSTHAELLHTIGNLTLTCYNPQLSDDPFDVKRVTFLESGLRMNKKIAECDAWAREQILERADKLADLAAGIWTGPLALADAGPDEASVVLAAIVAALPAGAWTDYASLATSAGMPLSSVITYVRGTSSLTGRHRVGYIDGAMDLNAPWAADDVNSYMQLLASEGLLVEIDDGPRFDPDLRLSSEELAELVDDA